MNNFRNLQNYSKSISTLAVYAVVISMFVSITTSNVYAAPKDPRYDSAQDCTKFKDKKSGIDGYKCCWREPIPGSILGQTYCQTCEGYPSTKCGDKERSMALAEQSEPLNPTEDNDIVAENPTTGQQSSPTSNPGVIVNEPLQQLESNNNGENEGDGAFSENTQSNSENTDNSFTPQESDGSSNFQESLDSDQREQQ